MFDGEVTDSGFCANPYFRIIPSTVARMQRSEIREGLGAEFPDSAAASSRLRSAFGGHYPTHPTIRRFGVVGFVPQPNLPHFNSSTNFSDESIKEII